MLNPFDEANGRNLIVFTGLEAARDISLVRRILIPLGYILELADNNDDALTKLQRRDARLLIRDCPFKNVEGTQLLHSIRRDPALFRIPVIALYAPLPGEADMALSPEDCPDGFLIKPCFAGELRSCVKRLAPLLLPAGRSEQPGPPLSVAIR